MADRLPALRPDEVIRALERAGFVRKRQSAHVIMYNDTTRRSVKQAGLTRGEFQRLLKG